ARMMRKQNLPLQRLATADALNAIATDLHYTDLSALYAAVGEGHVSAQSVVAKLVKSAGGVEGALADLAEATLVARQARHQALVGDSGVIVEGANDVWARLSKCCTPVPGDQITGFVTRGNGVSVHRADCMNLEHLLDSQPERLVNVRWSPREGSQFLVAIQVEALDRTGLLSDVTRSMSDQHVNILSATVTTTRDRVAFSRFTFEMGDPKHLGAVLRAVRSIDGVYDVYRVTNCFAQLLGRALDSGRCGLQQSRGSAHGGMRSRRNRGHGQVGADAASGRTTLSVGDDCQADEASHRAPTRPVSRQLDSSARVRSASASHER